MHRRHDRHHAHAQQTGDDGPTLMFQRSLPGHGERCALCPFLPADASPNPPRPILPRPPITAPHRPAATSPHPTATSPHPAASHRPAAISPHPAPSHRPPAPATALLSSANAPPAMLPRPALLAADLRGSGTLLLPDALRSAGPDAATIERPGEPYPHPIDTRRDTPHHTSTGRARDPDFDELASPDITVLQPVSAPTIPPIRPIRSRPRAAPLASARVYLALNLCLGLLIVGALVLLATRDVPSTAPSVSASE